MRIMASDLYCAIEQWDDPGDYPNNIAGGPLPSEKYCVFGGQFVFETITEEDEAELGDNYEDMIYDWVHEECDIDSECSIDLNIQKDGNRYTVTVKSAEYEPYEPDYE